MQNVKLLYAVNVIKTWSNLRIIPVKTICFGFIKTNLDIFCSYLNKKKFRAKEYCMNDGMVYRTWGELFGEFQNISGALHTILLCILYYFFRDFAVWLAMQGLFMHISALSPYLVSVYSEFKIGCHLIHFWGLCPCFSCH